MGQLSVFTTAAIRRSLSSRSIPHVCMCVYMYVCVCMYVRTYVCVYVCMYVCVCDVTVTLILV